MGLSRTCVFVFVCACFRWRRFKFCRPLCSKLNRSLSPHSRRLPYPHIPLTHAVVLVVRNTDSHPACDTQINTGKQSCNIAPTTQHVAGGFPAKHQTRTQFYAHTTRNSTLTIPITFGGPPQWLRIVRCTLSLLYRRKGDYRRARILVMRAPVNHLPGRKHTAHKPLLIARFNYRVFTRARVGAVSTPDRSNCKCVFDCARARFSAKCPVDQ